MPRAPKNPPPPPPPAAPTLPPAPPQPPAPPVMPMPEPIAPAAAPSSKKKKMIIIAVAAAVVLVGGGAAAMFLLGGEEAPAGGAPPIVQQPDVPAVVPQVSPWKESALPASGPMKAHAAIVSGDKLWIFGGLGADEQPIKTILSFDGTTWSEAGTFSTTLAWEQIVSFGSKLVRYGGVTGTPEYLNQIATSSDGLTWKSAGTLPGTRYRTPIIAVGNTLWSIGGRYIDPADKLHKLSRRVFSSKNGIAWTEAGNNSLPEAIGSAAAVVMNSTMWLFGGGSMDSATQMVTPGLTAWSSTDGMTWTAGTNIPLPLADACGIVYAGKVWLIGGATTGGPSAQVYTSPDGISWTKEADLPAALAAPSCTEYKGALVVVGNGKAYVYGELAAAPAPATDGSTSSEAATVPADSGMSAGPAE